MITMEMLGRIRRMYLRDKLSLHDIAKRTGLSRNTLRKWLKAPEDVTTPAYSRAKSYGKLAAFTEALEQSLKADAHRIKQDRRTAKALFLQIKVSGYRGGYSRVTDFIREWRESEGKKPHAFVPLTFELGEAFQFDWSEEGFGGGRHLPSDAGLPHEAVRQPRLLAGGLPQPGPRDAVRCPHALVCWT